MPNVRAGANLGAVCLPTDRLVFLSQYGSRLLEINMPLTMPDDGGPLYPELGSTVAKYRRMAVGAGGVMAMDKAMRNAYGEAIEKAIRAKQRSELQRELPSYPTRCASGTTHNDGADIHEAIRRRHRAALIACPAHYRRARPDHVWREMYEEAMAEKRAAAAPKKQPQPPAPKPLPIPPAARLPLRVVAIDCIRVAS